MRGRGLLVLVDRLGEGQGGDDKERTKYYIVQQSTK
jgi:hypothetical protein